MQKKAIAIMICLFVLTFALGIFVGRLAKSKFAPAGKDNTYQAGWDAAKAQLEKSGIGGVPAGMEVNTLSGTVDKISGNAITLKNASYGDPLADPELAVRVVQVSKNTRFYQLSEKDQAAFRKEMNEFNKKMQEQSTNKEIDPAVLAPPDMEIKKEIALSDIKEGQLISVLSNENIKDKKEFTASEIDVNFSIPALPGDENLPVPPPTTSQPGSVSAPLPPDAGSKAALPVPPAMPN